MTFSRLLSRSIDRTLSRRVDDRGFGSVLSGAAELLNAETQGLAIDFTDLSMVVKDTGTPANAFSGDPYSKILYTSPSPKVCRQADGTWKHGAHNLCPNSESTSGWIAYNGGSPVLTQGVTDPLGGTKAFSLTTDGVNRGVLANTGGSWGAPGLATAWVRSTSGTVSGNVYAQGTSGVGASAFTATTTWAQIPTPATATSGTTRMFIISLNSAGTLQFAFPHLYSDNTVAGYLTNAANIGFALPYEWNAAGTLLGIRVEPSRTNLFLNSRAPATQGITVTAAAHALSFSGTGSITYSGAASGTLNGTGVNDRVEAVFTPSAGTLTCTVSGTIDFVQLELGTHASSPIVTGAASVTRAGDAIGVLTSLFPAMTTAGSVIAHVGQLQTTTPGPSMCWASLNDTTLNNRQQLASNGAGSLSYVSVNGGATQASISGSTYGIGTHKFAMGYAVNDFVQYANGVADGTPDTSGTVTGTLTTLNIGSRNSGQDSILGYVKAITALPRRITNAEFATRTTL